MSETTAAKELNHETTQEASESAAAQSVPREVAEPAADESAAAESYAARRPHLPAAATSHAHAAHVPPASTSGRAYHRSPAVAGALSTIVPGFGNVYNGLFQRGLLNFVVFISLLFVATHSDGGRELALLVPSMIFTWLFGIADSVRQATMINLGIREADLVKRAEGQAGGGLAVGVALFLVGLWGLLSQVFDVDLTRLFDYWYVLLMGFGAWLVMQGVAQRRQSTEPNDEL